MLGKLADRLRGPRATANEDADTSPSQGRQLPRLTAEARAALEKVGAPLIDCAACPDPCDEEGVTALHSWTTSTTAALAKQEIDMNSEMLGTTAPFLRHVVISTSARDWPKHIDSVSDSLAHQFTELMNKQPDPAVENADVSLAKGCWSTDANVKQPTKVIVSNSSHYSAADAVHLESLFVFPDWLCISNVPSQRAAEESERAARSQTTESVFRRWLASSAPSKSTESIPQGVTCSVLPYSAVILLCSHKKRDVRCHLMAPVLAEAFRNVAERDGWQVDERGDDNEPHGRSVGGAEVDGDGLSTSNGFGFIDFAAADQERQAQTWRRRASSAKRLGLFYCSHIGGHRYAGNVIIYFPTGTGVWLGRVSPDPAHGDVERIWRETVIGGKVISEFLRAGINIGRPGKRVIDW